MAENLDLEVLEIGGHRGEGSVTATAEELG
jgi:hypothetical protein